MLRAALWPDKWPCTPLMPKRGGGSALLRLPLLAAHSVANCLRRPPEAKFEQRDSDVLDDWDASDDDEGAAAGGGGLLGGALDGQIDLNQPN